MCLLVVNHCQNDCHFLETQGWLVVVVVVEIVFKGRSNLFEENGGCIWVGIEDGVEELES